MELKGDIFIVPTSLNICDDRRNDQYGYDITNIYGLQVCFEGIITSPECDNWSCHQHPKLENKITSRFPVELFMGKKEGDTIEFIINNIKINVTCNQLNYKYNMNTFENVLYDLTQSFGGVCSAQYYKPLLTERSQMYLLIANHEKYSRSIAKEPKEPNTFKYSKNYIDNCKTESQKKPFLSFIESWVNFVK